MSGKYNILCGVNKYFIHVKLVYRINIYLKQNMGTLSGNPDRFQKRIDIEGIRNRS